MLPHLDLEISLQGQFRDFIICEILYFFSFIVNQRLTGVNAPIRYLKYEAIAGLQIQKEIHVGMYVQHYFNFQSAIFLIYLLFFFRFCVLYDL